MKALLACLLLLLPVVALPQTLAQSASIKTEYDRFSDTTSVSVVFPLNPPGVIDLGNGSVYVPPVSSTVLLSFVGSVPGANLKTTPAVTLIVTARSKDWIYLRVPKTLRAIQNGKTRILIGEARRVNSEVISGGVIEQLTLKIPFTVAKGLCESSKLELQIALDEFELSAQNLQSLKEWISQFSPPPRNKKR